MMEPYLGRSLVTADGKRIAPKAREILFFNFPVKTWKKERKYVNPVFNSKSVEEYYDIFDFHTNVLIDSFRKEVGKPSVDVVDYLDMFTLDVIISNLPRFM